MKVWVLSLILVSLVVADKYAIIMQGDRQYYNYSDSANSCRAYDDVLASGIPADHIIYMANEATMSDPQNPLKGQLFTVPDPTGPGIDHAAVCKEHFDYYGSHIEPDVILALLSQDEEQVKKLTKIENPKVFHTTEEDTLFIYYTDHGYEGGVGCGSGVITREQLLNVLKGLHDGKKYSKLVFYLEACESGSVFENLDPSWNIYAMTSADSVTPAWCQHCPPDDVVNGKSIGTCMSMYYDNSYQAFWESSSTKATIGEIFDHVHNEVKELRPDQTVCEFGNLDMKSEPITNYIGDKPIEQKRLRRVNSRPAATTSVPKSEVDRYLATWKAIRASVFENSSAMRELEQVVMNDAKREVETMRLGAQILGEQEANSAYKDSSRVVESTDCSRLLSTELIQHCHMSLPLPQGTKNMIHTICAHGVDFEAIRWNDVCL